MFTFKKILNIVYYVLILLFLAFIVPTFLYLSPVSEYVESFLIYDEVKVTLQIVAGIIAVGALIKLIIAAMQKKPIEYISIIEGPGGMRTSTSSLEKVVQNCVRDIPFVEECTVKSKYKLDKEEKQHIEINVRCGLDENKELVLEELNFIQDKVQKTIVSFLGMDINDINIDFYDVIPKHDNKTFEDLKNKMKKGRVN